MISEVNTEILSGILKENLHKILLSNDRYNENIILTVKVLNIHILKKTNYSRKRIAFCITLLMQFILSIQFIYFPETILWQFALQNTILREKNLYMKIFVYFESQHLKLNE